MLCNLRCVKARLRLLYNSCQWYKKHDGSFQDSLSYITFLFSKWPILYYLKTAALFKLKSKSGVTQTLVDGNVILGTFVKSFTPLREPFFQMYTPMLKFFIKICSDLEHCVSQSCPPSPKIAPYSTLGLVHTIDFLDPVMSLALFQLIIANNFFEFE